MIRFVRAAGYAAAVLGALVAPTFADRALAQGLELAAIESFEVQGTAPVAMDAQGISAQDGVLSDLLAQHVLHGVGDLATPSAKADLPAGSLASLVDAHAAVSASDREMECLAGAIYFESKGEPLAGQLAVAEVVINRTKSGKYPTSLCGVVKQPSQFSFVRGGRMPAINKDSPAWRKAVAIAHIARNDLADSPVPSAMSFHATYVSPRWRMTRLARVGRHIFYR